jgi:cell fate (sporulation/competence/biofilm development) regulator YlbF (YheA/YmcA/DUF963 family)
MRNEEEKVAILTQEVERLEQQLVRNREQLQELPRSREQLQELPRSREQLEELSRSREKLQELPRNREQLQARDVKNSREYQMLLKDLQLLLSHRDEISDMKQLVLKLQQNV